MSQQRFWVLFSIVCCTILILSSGAISKNEIQNIHYFSQEQLSASVKSLSASPSNLQLNNRVTEARLARLMHGINTGHWFAQVALTPKNFQTRITSEDIHQIRNMGFEHIRLPLDPNVLFDEKEPEKLNSKNLQYFDAALDMILSEDLAVIVDLHPAPKFMNRLFEDTKFANAVTRFWRALAQHLNQRNPELVFLEVLNEPYPKNPQKWYVLQRQMLAAMRAGAPKHTLIAAANQRVGNEWDSIKALELLTPLPDPNIVYNFHFYVPKIFTYQGATWDGWRMSRYFRQIPYPSNPVAVAPILPKIENETARKYVRHYGEQRWNAQRIDKLIVRAANWAKKNNVHLTCNEFGVYRQVAPQRDRNTWIRDVRVILEKYNIGWTMWEYNRGFGLMEQVDGELTPNQETLHALFEKDIATGFGNGDSINSK